jgi:cytochrome P450
MVTTADIGAKYDPFDSTFLANPQPVYRQLHREAPVCWSEIFESWLITRYHDVVLIMDNPTEFRSAGKDGPAPPIEVLKELEKGYPLEHMLYSTDPPEHTRLRALMQTAIAPDLVKPLEKSMRHRAHAVIDSIEHEGRAELYRQYIDPISNGAILDYIGVAPEDQEEVLSWHKTWETLFIPGREPDTLRESARQVVRYQNYLAALAERRRSTPVEDLISRMVHARAAGLAPLRVGELVWGVIEILGAAGNTNYGMVNALYRLLELPARWRLLGEARDLLTAAVEEGLRIESPVLGIARETVKECEIAGVKLPAEAPVLLSYAAANHDDSVFEHPEQFNLARKNPARQLTLGRGGHYCIGARIGRLMIRVATEVLLDRLPRLRLDENCEPEFYAPFPFLRSVSALPARWD